MTAYLLELYKPLYYRVIGKTSTQHEGMRQGVKVSDVCDALKNGTAEKDYVIRDDYRR